MLHIGAITLQQKQKNERVMDYIKEFERLGERFPNKNVGCGNPAAKILVVTQRVENEAADFEYLEKLFRDLPNANGKDIDILSLCYYIVYDEDILKDPFFEHFQIVQYAFTDGNHLQRHDPAHLLGMKWISGCTIEDGLQRMFVAHDSEQNERLMCCTYPFESVSETIICSNRLLLNWYFRNETTFPQ